MSKLPFEFKIVIAGPFGVGKTTLISNISAIPVVGTEVATTGDEALEKESTTVGLEYGVLEVETDEFDISLSLFGTPGQERFRFMWDAVAVGADGFVVLVDGTRPDTWDDAMSVLSYFTDLRQGHCVVGANRTTRLSSEYVRVAKHMDQYASVPVIPCDIAEPQSARDLIVALIEEILSTETVDMLTANSAIPA